MISMNRAFFLSALLPLCANAQAVKVWNDQASVKVWDTESAGTWGNSAWKNGPAESAAFRGQGGTITLSQTITANALNFSGNGYVLKGEPLKFAGQAPAITVAKGKSATIQSNLSATGTLTKDGEGTLKLVSKNAHSLPVKLTVTAGVLQVDGMAFSLEKMGPSGVLTVAKGAKIELLGSHVLGGSNLGLATDIRVDGGTLTQVIGSQYFKRLALNGGSVLGAGDLRAATGAEIQVKGRASEISCKEIVGGWDKGAMLTFAVEASGSGKPDLRVSSVLRNLRDEGAGQFGIKKTGAGMLVLSGSNDYRGPTVITDGVVSANSATALGNSSAVEISAGTLSTDCADLAVGSLSISGGELRLNGDAMGSVTLAADANLRVTGGFWRVSVGPSDSDKIVGSGKGTFSVSGLVIDFGGAELPASADVPLLNGFASGSVEKIGFTGYDVNRWTVDLDAAGMLHVRSTTSKWVIPVVVGGVLLLVAGVVVFLMRKGKGKGKPVAPAGKPPAGKLPDGKPPVAAVPPPPSRGFTPPPPPPPPPRPPGA
jgi:autotransporter-associated beta strand protein